jgi:hypothetical protein
MNKGRPQKRETELGFNFFSSHHQSGQGPVGMFGG